MVRTRSFLTGLILLATAAVASAAPLRVLLAGLAHGHAGGFLRQADPSVVTLVGVWEPDEATWARYERQPRLAGVKRHVDLTTALQESNAEAVWAFSDTRTHRAIVEAAAPRGLAVIVEKPLAISWPDAQAMAELARRHRTLVLTNYETSWYPVFHDIRSLIASGQPLGPVRQIYVQAGHEGPVRIKVGPEFLAWLRDPERAGGGALFDFGCYGANLATWWLGNRAPDFVWATTATYDPVNYPACDDHAVIQMDYAGTSVTVVGSWHWTYARKDSAIYGESGAVVTKDDRAHTLRLNRGREEARQSATPRRVPLEWFAQVIRAGRDPEDDPSSLANNLITMRILEAARRSAREGRRVPLAELTGSTIPR
jgi:predicted dehydrogenase